MPDEVPLDTLNISTSKVISFASILSKYCIDELIATECGTDDIRALCISAFKYPP